jgi:aspartate/methionine/tyrosine aminotransferase
MLSSRLPKDLTPSPFFAELERAKAQVLAECADARGNAVSLPFIDMTVSSPLRVGLPFDLAPAVDEAKSEFGTWVADAAGRRDAREAVAEYYRERGGAFTVGQIILTASTSEAYSVLFKTFCDPGDVILTPMPGYPLLDTLAQLEHLECAPYFLKLKREAVKARVATNKVGLEDERRKRSNVILEGQSPDRIHKKAMDSIASDQVQEPKALKSSPFQMLQSNKRDFFRFVLDSDSLLAAPERAKILLLVSPHNPTGHCVSREEWNEAVRFCEENNMILVVDEVFADYAFSDKVQRSWKYLFEKGDSRSEPGMTSEASVASECLCPNMTESNSYAQSATTNKTNDDQESHPELSLSRSSSCKSSLTTSSSTTSSPTTSSSTTSFSTEGRESIHSDSNSLWDAGGGDFINLPEDGPKCPIFWLNGLSKAVGSPQLKLGWMAFYAPREKFEEIRAALEFVEDAYLSVSAPAQSLARPMLAASAAYESRIRERLLQNWNTLREAFPSKYCPEVLGGWYAVVRLGEDDEEITLRLLREKHVLVQPGFFFDFDEDGWAVISLLQEPAIFKEAIHRILQ